MPTEIDPQSSHFIAWTRERIQSPAFYQELVKSCQQQMAAFLDGTPDPIQTRLIAKLEHGAREYGAASFSTIDIEDELKQEYIDVLGWSLIKHYLAETRG